MTLAPKPVFKTVKEALIALSIDKLGAAYRNSKEVFVVTAHGTGTFTVKEWEAGK